MAKKTSRIEVDVSGLSINEIMNIDAEVISKLSLKSMKQITSRLISASNKRLRNLGKTDLGRTSPAYMYIEKEYGGKFSLKTIKGKNQLQQTQHLFAKVSDFLNKKTSSVAGWKEVRQDVEKRLGLEPNAIDTKYKAKRFWKAYRKLYDASGGGILDSNNFPKSKRNSDRMQKMLYDRITEKGWNKNFDSIIDNMTKKGGDIEQIYKEEQKKMNDNSNFIVIDGLDKDEEL